MGFFFGGDSEEEEEEDMTDADIILEPESRSESERVDWPPTFLVVFDANSDGASREPEPEPEESDIILMRICYLFVSNQLH